METFNTYFDSNISMKSGNAPLHDILSTVAGRYIGQNRPALSDSGRFVMIPFFLMQTEAIIWI